MSPRQLLIVRVQAIMAEHSFFICNLSWQSSPYSLLRCFIDGVLPLSAPGNFFAIVCACVPLLIVSDIAGSGTLDDSPADEVVQFALCAQSHLYRRQVTGPSDTTQ